MGYLAALSGFVDDQKGLEEYAQAVLNVLSQGVQVCGHDHRGGEEALVLLAFALTVQLFPPFRQGCEPRLPDAEEFDQPAALVELVAVCRILQGGVILQTVVLRAIFSQIVRTAQHLFNPDPRHRERQ